MQLPYAWQWAGYGSGTGGTAVWVLLKAVLCVGVCDVKGSFGLMGKLMPNINQTIAHVLSAGDK